MHVRLILIVLLLSAVPMYCLSTCNNAGSVDIQEMRLLKDDAYNKRAKCEQNMFSTTFADCTDYYKAELDLSQLEFAEQCQWEDFQEQMSRKLGFATDQTPVYATDIMNLLATVESFVDYTDSSAAAADVRLSSKLDTKLLKVTDSISTRMQAALKLDEVASDDFQSSKTIELKSNLEQTFLDILPPDGLQAVLNSIVSSASDAGSSLESVVNLEIENTATAKQAVNDLNAQVPPPESSKSVSDVIDFSLLKISSEGYVLTHPLLGAILPDSNGFVGYQAQLFQKTQKAIDLFKNNAFDVSTEQSQYNQAVGKTPIAAYNLLSQVFGYIS